MTDDDNHYTELREIYLEHCRQHSKVGDWLKEPEEFQPPLSTETGPSMKSFLLGYRKALIETIADEEDLLNEWHDRDDRDGDGEQ